MSSSSKSTDSSSMPSHGLLSSSAHPGSATLPSAAVNNPFEARSDPGAVYEVLGDSIIDRPQDYLGSGELAVNVQYQLVDHPPSRPGSWTKTTANEMNRMEEELRVTVFGELCGEAWGKRVSARGTWVPGVNDDGTRKVINDGTSVKNRLVVRCPTRPTAVVESAFENQLCEIKAFEDAVVEHSGSLNNSLLSFAPDGVTQLLSISMEQTYKDTRARRRASEKAPVAPTKQKVCVANLKSLRSGGAAKNEANAPSSSAVGSAASDVGHSGASSGSSTPHSNPPAWNPDMPITGDTPATLGASYPVGCLPDHRGPDFDHRRSVVPQHEVWSLQNRLIHPRDLPFHLKPGVLLLIEGKFCVWHTPGGESLVQFVTDAVKIIADSNEDPELPSTDITATPSPRASAPSAPKRTAAFAEFGRSGSSSTPCKRPKIDDSDFDIASAELGSMGLDDDADRRDEKKQANGKAGGSGKGKGRAK